MSQEERTGWRDPLYSGWHRIDRLRRYLPPPVALKQTLIDIDCCEACGYCDEPVALIELQRSSGPPKPATITNRLARRARIPAFSVSYEPSTDGLDIVAFQVQRREPWDPALSGVYKYTPEEYAWFLVRLRYDHFRTERPDCGQQFSRLIGWADAA